MTAHIISFPIQSAFGTNYLKAVSILEKTPFSNQPIQSLDDIFNSTKKAVEELATDIDFCDNKHEASLYALRWSFDRVYQQGIPLEQKQFFNLCGHLVISDETNSSTRKKEHWYKNY